jgi:hypothetical protein
MARVRIVQLSPGVKLDFRVVKLLDYADRLEELLLDPNPFALVTAAHLLSRQTRGDAERPPGGDKGRQNGGSPGCSTSTVGTGSVSSICSPSSTG